MNFQSCIVFNGFVYVFCVPNVCVIVPYGSSRIHSRSLFHIDKIKPQNISDVV